MFGRSHATRQHCALLVDIGSASAGVAILELNPKAKSRLIASHRIFLTHVERDTQQTMTGILGLIKDAIARVQKQVQIAHQETAPIPEELFVCVRSPWSHSVTREREHMSSTEERITQAILDSLSNDALAQETEIDTKRLLEASVTRIEINGYPTAKPIGKRGQSVKATILLSDVEPEFKKSIESTLQSYYPTLKPQWRSHTRALITLIREQSSELVDTVIVDLAREGTGISIVRNGVIVEQLTIREGADSILSRISSGGMPEETLSLMKMFELEQCSTAQCETIKSSLGRAEIELVRIFAEPLGQLAVRGKLPTQLSLVTVPELAPWLTRFFSRIDFSQFTITAQPFAPVNIGFADTAQWISANTGIMADVSLAIGSTLVHIEHQSGKSS